MASGADQTSRTGASALPVEHWVFGSSPETGYGVKARSRDLNLSLYERHLDGIYAPLTGATLHGDAGPVDVVMLHSANAATELLFTLISSGPNDAFGRKTFHSHTAVLPLDLLASSRLGFPEVDDAIRGYEADHANDTGLVDPLRVTLRDPTQETSRLGAGIGRYLSRASAETLLTRWESDPDSRTLVLCRDASQADRRLTLLKIVEVLNLLCKLPVISGLSDQPAGGVLNRFQLVVAPKAFRADNTWVLLDNALETPSLPRRDDPQGRYEKLAECFGTRSPTT